MRISIIKQAKNFILESKEKDKYVYLSNEIKLSLKNYLISNGLLYSPIRGIYVLKSSSVSSESIINKYKYELISKLGGVITGDFALNYYLGNYKKFNEITLINKSKNFISYIGEKKQIKVNFKLSKINRITDSIEIEGSKLQIESPLSFIVNNFFSYKDNKKFETLILKQEIEPGEVINMILAGFKISGLSKLAIFYKNNHFNGKFKMIEREIIESGKKLDRRNNKINIKKIIKKKVNNKIEDLDLLFDL